MYAFWQSDIYLCNLKKTKNKTQFYSKEEQMKKRKKRKFEIVERRLIDKQSPYCRIMCNLEIVKKKLIKD
jgi:hypothetical protein